jgi:transposase
MIVIGTDTHKQTHTCGAVEGATARALAERTAKARRQGFDELLGWARALGTERVWAIEDCRQVSGSFERFLIARGERIVRVAPKHMAGARKSARERGKSDSIDAFAIAHAALKEGIETLPTAHLDEGALEIRLLLDHHDDLVAARSADQQRLRWHLHDLWPELEIPAGALDRAKWLAKAAGRLTRAEQGARVRIARARATDQGAHPRGARARARTRPAGVGLRAPAARRAGLRAAHGRQADRRDRRGGALRQ